MERNFFKEWFNAIRFPMPVIWATKEAWKEFAENADFSRVKKAFKENCKVNGWERVENVYVLAKRLSKGGWPKLSEEFVKKYSGQIFMVTSRETAMSEIRSYQYTWPLYLVDKSHQMIGIIIDKDTVITGFTEESVYPSLAKRLYVKGYLPTKEQMRLIGENEEQIKKLLKRLDLEVFSSNCWATDGKDVIVWGSPNLFRPVINSSDLACLMFLL